MDTRSTSDEPDRASATGRRVDSLRGRRLAAPSAASEAWRRERLYLYLFWLERRDKSPFNFVGGWHTSDMGEEDARWSEALQGLDYEAALAIVERELALRFGKSWQDALAEGASPLLATANMPIWNTATASLLPAYLGRLTLFRAESYTGKPALGWSYNYGRAGSSEKLSLTLYTQGQVGLRDGLSDPQVPGQLGASWLDIRRKVEKGGGRLLEATLRGPMEELLLDRYNRKVAFLAMQGEAVDSDQVARFEAVSMRVFRGHFLKVRYTRRAAPEEARDIAANLDGVKSDLAEFIASFS
jgi:hypothetical protein